MLRSMSTRTSSKPNGRPLKRTKRACAQRAKALATGKGRVPREVAAKRLATKCPPPGKRRKANGTDLTVANTILAQLGGAARLTAMLGASGFVGSEDALSFRIKAANKHKIKVIRVTLEPSDTYRVELWSIKGSTPTLVKSLTGIYNDGLIRAIEEETGLYLSLSGRKPNAGFGWSTTKVSGKKVIVAENGKPLFCYAVVDGRGAKLEAIYATTDAHARKQLAARTPKAKLLSKAHVLATSPHGRSLLRQGMRKANGGSKWIVVGQGTQGAMYLTEGGHLSKLRHMAKSFTSAEAAQKAADKVTRYGIPAVIEPVSGSESEGNERESIPHVDFDIMRGDVASIISRTKRTDGPFVFYEYRVAIRNSRNPLQRRTVTLNGDEHGRVRLPASNGDLIATMVHLAKEYGNGRKTNGGNMVEVKVLSRTRRRQTVRGATFNSYDLVMQVPDARGRATTLRLTADANGEPNLPDEITDGTLRAMILAAARNYRR